MKNKILAKFRYNKKTYVFYLDEAGKVLYGYYGEGNKILNINTEEEEFLINEVSKQIFVSNDPNNHVKFNTLNYKGKLYQLMFDKVSQLRFLYEIKEGKYCVPNLSDVGDLLKIYNEASQYRAKLGIKNIGKNLILKKVVKIGSLFLVVLFTTQILCSPQSEKVYIEKPILSYKYPMISHSHTEFSIDKIVGSLESNVNLTDSEKKFFLQFNDFLEENSRYINMEIILPRLKKFKNIYHNYEKVGVWGFWDGNRKEINLYSSTSLDDCDLTLLTHEYMHIFQTYTGSFGRGVYEAVGETLANEFREYKESSKRNIYKDSPYQKNCTYIKMLCEIINPEYFIAHYLTGNPKYIVNELKKIIPDENKALELINSIDNVMIYESDYFQLENAKASEKDLFEKMLDITSNHKKIYILMSDYFYASKGYKIEEDAIMMLYYKELNEDYSKKDVIEKEKALKFKIKKGYFVKSYINMYPEASIETINGIIRITEENRRFSGQRDKDGNFIIDNEFLPSVNVR